MADRNAPRSKSLLLTPVKTETQLLQSTSPTSLNSLGQAIEQIVTLPVMINEAAQ